MSRKTAKRLLWWGILGLLTVATVFGVWATHGFLWSIYVPIYDQLLSNLPSPPGLLPETDEMDLNPEAPWGYRTYQVDGDHLEIVNFFATQLPSAGWESIEHDDWSTQREQSAYLQVDHMLFVNQHSYWRKRYWIIVDVYTNVAADGNRRDNSLVTLEVHRNEEIAGSRYRP